MRRPVPILSATRYPKPSDPNGKLANHQQRLIQIQIP